MDVIKSVPRRGVTVFTCALALLLFLVYAAAPTRNHYWDGIGFALNIEGVPQDELGHYPHAEEPGAIYYNPNHLLYNAIGRALYVSLQTLAPRIRALDVLVWWSIVSSVASAGMLFHLLLRLTSQTAVSVWLTLLFAFSATWWKFSTDANAYVPGTAMLLVCAVLAARRKGPPVVWIGLCHALAMLLHQIAICFYPAMLLAIWTHRALPDRAARLRMAWRYMAVSGGAVTVAYLTVWLGALGRAADPAAFLRWLTFNGSDVLARKSVLGRVGDMLLANLRVLFGGKLSLALGFLEPVALIGMAAVVLVCAGLIVRAGWRREWRGAKFALPEEVRFPLVWLAGFLVFLSVWLTEYPYYRLFCLPAFILLLGGMLRGADLRGRTLSHPLPAFVVLMATLNFGMYIGPYARVEANPPLHVALTTRPVWTGDVVVFFTEFTCDNWWMKYFNMDTSWRKADLQRMEHFEEAVMRAIRSGRRVYLDTGVVAHMESKPAAQQRLLGKHAFGRRLGVSNGKHHIQFVELRPRGSSAAD